jgi:hypothetical protein
MSREHFANYDHEKPLTLLHEELNEAEFEGVMISECLCNLKGVYWYVHYEQQLLHVQSSCAGG